MRTMARTFGLLSFLFLTSLSGKGQKATFTTNDGLIIGFGMGESHQNSDIANSTGLGFDFVLGSQLFMKEGAFLSADWKFRFLAGDNRAFDHRINTDNTYSNIRYSFFNYDLELGLTLNRLRERTRIIVSGFAGLGITHGRTFTDRYNAAYDLYDFSGIDPNRDSRLIYNDLLALSDGTFETRLVNKAALLPTAGFYLGYQFTRSFSLGFEYKTNFNLTEYNSFSGINIDNRILSGSGPDRNSYTGLRFIWNLRRSSPGVYDYSDIYTDDHSGNNVVTDPGNHVVTPPVNVVPVPVPLPTVSFTDPADDYVYTETESVTLRALVRNVEGAYYISFYQNGSPVYRFNYDAATGMFTAAVVLADGENVFNIKAVNSSGTAGDLVTIVLRGQREVTVPLPAAAFVDPRESRVSVPVDMIHVVAIVENVGRAEDIQLLVNDRPLRFDFNPSSGAVNADVPLNRGDNTLQIRASNEAGTAGDRLDVYSSYVERTPPPTVRFVYPPYPVNVDDNRYNLLAQTQNVYRWEDISLRLNGRLLTSFEFFESGEVGAALILAEGTNTIEITARNETGFVTERTNITYVRPVQRLYPPQITITVPGESPFATYEATAELRATIQNIASKDRITLTVNGMNTGDFTFDSRSRELRAGLALNPGQNVVTLSARNDDGSDVQTQVFVRAQRQCPTPVITILEPGRGQNNTSQPYCTLRAEVRNVRGSGQIRLTSNGNEVNFSMTNSTLTASVPLLTGLNTLVLNARNECGEDQATVRMNYSPVVTPEPCFQPKISFAVNPLNGQDATHELQGNISGMKSRNGISMLINGRPDEGFQFTPGNGELLARLRLSPGSYSVVITARNECGSDSYSTTITVDEPCYPPKVSFSVSPVTASDASHELKGLVTNVKTRTGISLQIDGRAEDGFQFQPATGELSMKLRLSPGTHSITVSARNECGSDMGNVNINSAEPCTPPKLSVNIAPVSGNDATHELRGTVSNIKNKTGISVLIDGRSDEGFQFIPATGELSMKLRLDPGTHTVVVTVHNDCGSDNRTITVTAAEPCTPPKLSCTVNPVSGSDATHELRGSVSNIKNKTGISVLVDGRSDEGFQFIPTTGELSMKLRLGSGTHTVVVTVHNDCGSDNRTMTVTAAEPCTPPKLSCTVNPVSGSDATHELRGSVSNIKNKTGVSVLVDGRSDEGFQFVPTTGELTMKLRLSPGTHTVVVTVRNECGSDNRTLTVTAAEPCTPPKLSCTVNPVSGSDATHELRGTVSDIKNKTGISVLIDGRSDEGFQFIPTTGELSMKLRLGPGTHIVVVTVHNDCGSDNRTMTVTAAEPCTPPKLSCTVNPVSGSDATHELSGTVSNIKNKTGISVLVDGRSDEGFQFIPTTGELSMKLRLSPGTHTVVVTVRNECGSDNRTLTVTAAEPCTPPKLSCTVNPVSGSDATHELRGSVSNIKNKTGISVLVDGRSDEGFQFVPTTGELTMKLRLSPGTHTVVVTVRNECGSDNRTLTVTAAEPCTPPKLSCTVNPVSGSDATHELSGTVSNIKNKTGISVLVDGRSDEGFQFVPTTGELTMKLRLSPGTHTVVVTVRNECGSDNRTLTATVQEAACGPRINPGSAPWQFCLVTSSRTYTRNDLGNPNFSYSGPASSLFFMPIAGGGDALVNGRPFPLRPGQYYLFTGSLYVTVSTKNAGSMGQWSVCIRADREPVSGNGANRPKSPCEEEEGDGIKEKGKD
ncbi:MAG: hypothetical protein ACOYXB_16810 [Bacteroidota bacterium]